ncbi:hypothetical protein N431DRAFT_468288 [Stipitochalara longipes BDJ]|nr:hypothetical protein N431DRAFT_468288 [Stipitochalara longipes BDJ]
MRSPFHAGNALSTALFLLAAGAFAWSIIVAVRQDSANSPAFILSFFNSVITLWYLAHETIPSVAFGENNPTKAAITKQRFERFFLLVSFISLTLWTMNIGQSMLTESWAMLGTDVGLFVLDLILFAVGRSSTSESREQPQDEEQVPMNNLGERSAGIVIGGHTLRRTKQRNDREA